MRYVVDINQNQAEEIELLLKKGKYQSFAQFILTAVENQIYIEKEGIKEPKVEPVSSRTIIKEFHDKNGFPEEKIIVDLSVTDIRPKAVSMPTFPQLAYSLENREEEKTWMWGQINRIFPIKLGLRILLVYAGSDQWMDLESFKEKAADIALGYGNMLKGYEKRKDKKRDEKISAGLPTDKDKSKMRYQSHFLAYVRKDGKLDGAMPFLRFANLQKTEKGKTLIGITDAGLSFAKLDNSVIDHNNFESSLDSKEIDFYLDHISKDVKGEFCAMKWLLDKLVDGITDREEINGELKKEFGEVWKTSDAVINTQRAGLMARMFELGLIEKKKDGVAVTYKISTDGRNFLNKIK